MSIQFQCYDFHFKISSFLNKLSLSEPGEINGTQVDCLNDIPLLPQSSFALIQSPTIFPSDAKT